LFSPLSYKGIEFIVIVVVVVMHIADMHQTFDAVLQFHKEAKGSDAADNAGESLSQMGLHILHFL
jgi:hypothetical protein